MDFGKLKLIRYGFWLGVGLIIPLVGSIIVGTLLMITYPSFFTPDSEELASSIGGVDKTKQIRISELRKSVNGNQVLVLGVIENAGPDEVKSVNIEAEFFGSDKKMVYECSEYVSQKIRPAEKENFQIKCGCKDQPMPEHESYVVRVINASSY